MTTSNLPLEQPKQEVVTLQSLRERILRVLSIATLIIGSFVVLATVRSLEIGSDFGTSVPIFVVLLIIILLVFFIPQVPYALKAGLLIAIIYALWPISIFTSGLQGDARVWFVLTTLLATVFFGIRVGLGMVMLTGFTYGVMAFGTSIGFIPSALDWTLNFWISSGVTLVFIELVISLSIGAMINSLDGNLQILQVAIRSEQELATILTGEQETLKSQTENLERRNQQIRTAAEISRSLGTILDPQELIEQVANLIKDRFDLYYVGVFLNDDRNHFSVLAVGTGEAGQRMLAQQHKLTIGGSSMVGWATAHNKPRVALDVGEEAIRFRNPHLPLTRSELAIPLSIGSQNSGAVTVQSTQPNAFDDDDITILQSIADSLAITLENAKLFQQIDESLQEIQQLNQTYTADSWEDVLLESDNLSILVEQDILESSEEDKPVNIPLTLRNNQVIGNITLEGATQSWGGEDMEFIEAISNQAALALESARLLNESQRRVQREQSLNDLTTRFSRTLDFDTLMQTVVKELGQLPNVKEASIHFSPPEPTHAGIGETEDDNNNLEQLAEDGDNV